MGFGGTSPCAQKKGDVIFIEEHPEELLVSGRFTPKPVVFGTNKHEGSFVLGGTQWARKFNKSPGKKTREIM